MSFLKNWLSKSKEADAIQTRITLNKLLKTMRESVIVVGEDTRILASNQAAFDSFARRSGTLPVIKSHGS